MLSFIVQSINLPKEHMVGWFWMMKQSNVCSTPALIYNAPYQWIEKTIRKSLHYLIFTSTERYPLSVLIKTRIFVRTIESEASVTKSSLVVQIAMLLKMKPSRQDNMKRSLLNFKQASLRGVGICSMYCLLCLEYGVYSEMTINLAMMEIRQLILSTMCRCHTCSPL